MMLVFPNASGSFSANILCKTFIVVENVIFANLVPAP